MKDVDISTFYVNKTIDKECENYAKDKNHVYYPWHMIAVDADTFGYEYATERYCQGCLPFFFQIYRGWERNRWVYDV